MALITAAQLHVFAMGCDYMAIAPKLDAACQEVGIAPGRELRDFMAQMHVESMGFRRFEEDLNYSAQRLTQVWPHLFPDVAAATPYAGNPAALAEKVYGGRAELGNITAGDGAKYIGRSLVMITGKVNYAQASKWVDIDLVANPQQAASIPVACRIGAHWWKAHGLSQIALSAGSALDICRAERLRIDGGLIGEAEAENQQKRAGFIWGN